MLVLNHPYSPTGNVFSPAELELAAEVAAEEDLMVVADEIYERVIYTDDYVNPVEVGGLAGRTIAYTGLSKTCSMAGWHVGFALAPESLSAELRKVHGYTSICVPTPFQRADVEAPSLPAGYYDDLSNAYGRRGGLLCDGLRKVGLDPVKPNGAYCILTYYPGDTGGTEFTHRLIHEAGVTVIPGSSFYTEGSAGWVRFTFSWNEATIEKTLRRLDENRFW